MKILGFLSILIALILVDFYAFQGVKTVIRDLPQLWQKGLKTVYWSLPVAILIGTALIITGVIDRSNKLGSQVFFTLIYLNFLPKIFFALFLSIDDLRRLVTWFIQLYSSPNNTKGIERSDFLVRLGIAATALPIYSVVKGITKGAHDYKIYRSKIKSTQIPASFNGLKIVQISDIHAGSFYDLDAVQKGIDKIKSLKPDLIFFTGDLVNNKADEVYPFLEMFGQLKAPLGVYSVLGNHDYGDYVAWSSTRAKTENLNALKRAHEQMGWKLLLDEHLEIAKGNDKINLLGVENWGDGFVQKGDLSKAFNNVDPKLYTILLSHDPTHWDAEVRPNYKDINLTLAGHTHGMQMGIENRWVKWSPASLRYKQWGGLYTKGNQQLYVNRGFGYLAFPGRIGIRPEITLLELERS